MVLALARSSEPWCFPAGSCFFSKLFYCQQYCQQLQAIESRQKGFFSRISAFFEAVLLPVAAGNRISRSLEKRCFSRILGYFFSTLFYCLSKKVIFLGFQAGRFFSRISDDTLGTFLAWFWHSLVLQSHGVPEHPILISINIFL